MYSKRAREMQNQYKRLTKCQTISIKDTLKECNVYNKQTYHIMFSYDGRPYQRNFNDFKTMLKELELLKKRDDLIELRAYKISEYDTNTIFL